MVSGDNLMNFTCGNSKHTLHVCTKCVFRRRTISKQIISAVFVDNGTGIYADKPFRLFGGNCSRHFLLLNRINILNEFEIQNNVLLT